MIFVTTGTCKPFDRLISHLDSIAPLLEEDVFAQIGNCHYIPEHISWERFSPSLDDYIRAARLVISHGGASCLEIIKAGTPLLVVPRQKRYNEHFDDQQVEFAQLLYDKYRAPFFTDIDELGVEIISRPPVIKPYSYYEPD